MAAMNSRPQQREFDDLETREPKFFGFLKKAAGLVLREDENGDIYVHDLDRQQLDARDPKFFGKFIKKAAGLVLREDANGEYYVAREYDDIDAREPKFPGFLKKIAKFVIRETPEFDELD